MDHTQTWLALSHPLVVIVFGCAFWAVRRTDARRPAYLLSLSLAYFSYAGGVTLQILHLPSSVATNVGLSTLLYLLAVVLLARGMTLLARHPYPWLPGLAVLAITVSARLWLVLITAPAVWRFYTLHIAITVILLHGAWLSRSLWHKSKSERVLYLTFLLIGLGNLPRTLLASRASLENYGFDFGPYWLATQISFYVLATVFALALIMSIMQHRVRFEQSLSESDPLTGLLNRRGFQRAFESLSLPMTPYCLLLGDLDHFKHINDAHGHEAGDRVLVQLGQLITTHVRPSDIPARIGGEEFAVILPHTGFEEGIVIAERIRNAVATTTFLPEIPDTHVRISLGMAACLRSTPLKDALRLADGLLYRAKAEGRNKVVCAKS